MNHIRDEFLPARFITRTAFCGVGVANSNEGNVGKLLWHRIFVYVPIKIIKIN